jgi:hypothetical protein
MNCVTDMDSTAGLRFPTGAEFLPSLPLAPSFLSKRQAYWRPCIQWLSSQSIKLVSRLQLMRRLMSGALPSLPPTSSRIRVKHRNKLAFALQTAWPQVDLWILWTAPLMSDFWVNYLWVGRLCGCATVSSWRIPPRGCAAGWEFPAQSVPGAEMHVFV